MMGVKCTPCRGVRRYLYDNWAPVLSQGYKKWYDISFHLCFYRGNSMAAFTEEKVLSVHHWTDHLFSFTCTRNESLRFSNGHFVMIGLRVDNKPLVRAYSIASANS